MDQSEALPLPPGEALHGTNEITANDFVWLLGALCRLHRLAFDATLVRQQFPSPYGRAELIEAARALGFRAGEAALGQRNVAELPLPCIAFLKSGRPALVLKHDGGRFVYVEAQSEVPSARPAADFAALFAPAGILVAHEAAQDEALPGFEDEKEKFGFRWFVPALARHKEIWRDVLIASLAIQIVGLATPLFTQVIIDKVLMHKMMENLALFHAAFEFQHVIDFRGRPALTLDVFQLEAAGAIHVVLEAALAEDEVVREIHKYLEYGLTTETQREGVKIQIQINHNGTKNTKN